jgi:hypothetical protein
MSRVIINKFLGNLFEYQIKILNNGNNKLLGLFLCGVVSGHGLYTYGSTNKKIIDVDKKYTFERNGYTEFMIIDKNGDHYNVNNSLWYWKWDSIEDWNKITTDKQITVKYYGFRIPVLGVFPNIVNTNILDSISSAECRIYEFNNNNENINNREQEKILNPYYQYLKK